MTEDESADNSSLWVSALQTDMMIACPTCGHEYDVRKPQKTRYLCHRSGAQIVPVLVCAHCDTDIMSARQRKMVSDGELLDLAGIVGLDPLGFLR